MHLLFILFPSLPLAKHNPTPLLHLLFHSNLLSMQQINRTRQIEMIKVTTQLHLITYYMISQSRFEL
jgi:hypothetical protein